MVYPVFGYPLVVRCRTGRSLPAGMPSRLRRRLPRIFLREAAQAQQGLCTGQRDDETATTMTTAKGMTRATTAMPMTTANTTTTKTMTTTTGEGDDDEDVDP